MPNWCHCALNVEGPTRDIDAFLRDSCGCIGRDIDRWEVRWKALDARLASDVQYSLVPCCEARRRVAVEFRSPWRAPRDMTLRASELHPRLRFELDFFEPINEIEGQLVFEAGLLLQDGGDR